jgi:hypothetical protein
MTSSKVIGKSVGSVANTQANMAIPALSAKGIETISNMGEAESSEDDMSEVAVEALMISMEVLDEKKGKEGDLKRMRRKVPGYYSGLSASTANKRAAQFKKQTKMSDDNPAAYKKAPGDGEGTKRVSKWTKAYHRKYGEGDTMDESLIFDDVLLEGLEVQEEVIVEAITGKTRKALQNKAEDSNVPLGVLTTVYRKGLAAWKTGHRPGAGQHQWAMARVNSFLAGGPARRVDAPQWERVKDHRKKKRKR